MRRLDLKCGCGNVKHYRYPFLLLRFVLYGEKIYWRCPQCGKVSCFRLVYHVVHDSLDDKERELNKGLKIGELWKRG